MGEGMRCTRKNQKRSPRWHGPGTATVRKRVRAACAACDGEFTAWDVYNLLNSPKWRGRRRQPPPTFKEITKIISSAPWAKRVGRWHRSATYVYLKRACKPKR